MKEETNVLIVGAGCFGISTALHLLLPRKSGAGSDTKPTKYNVTVLDRSPILPAPDAASTDLNKGMDCYACFILGICTLIAIVSVVRSSYHDVFYTRLAREAIHEWKDRDAWGDCYHESVAIFTKKCRSITHLICSDVAYLCSVLGSQSTQTRLS